MKTYTMYYTTSRTNVTLHLGLSSSSTKPVYYGEGCCLGWITHKPQILLRAGDSKSSPIVAAARLHVTSRNIQLGLGDPAGSIVWEDMRREKLRLVRSDYEFDTSHGDEKGVKRSYSWAREKVSMRTVYKCVDDAGAVVASMSSGGMFNWQKGGEIEVAEGIEKPFEEMLILSALSIFYAEAGWSTLKGYESGNSKQKDLGGSASEASL